MNPGIALIPLLLTQQPPVSRPDAGEERRAIKALPPDEVAGYLEGQGMGYAKAAELNHYPGPKHVLELAGELGLTGEQRAGAEEVRARMHAAAVRLGRQVVEQESALDLLFEGATAETAAMEAAVREIARLQGELRAVHLRAHVEMRAALTPAQIALYDRLRGYDGPAGHAHPRHH